MKSTARHFRLRHGCLWGRGSATEARVGLVLAAGVNVAVVTRGFLFADRDLELSAKWERARSPS